MLNLQLAHKYSRAIFEIAQEENQLEAYEKELRGVRRDLDSVPGIWGYFQNPEVERKDQKEILKRAFGGELRENVYNFLLLLVDKRRFGLFPVIVDQYVRMSNEARGIVIADVTSAGGLSEAEEKRLKDKLESISGKKVELRLHQDPSIIGGVIVKIGDKRIDGSVTGRLAAMRQDLLGVKG
jgi:F-type H+-transporting ATPase subunit delta